MQKNKLYSILSYFNKYEQNRLRKYLISPYFNKNEDLVKLFEILIEDINKKEKNSDTQKVQFKELEKENLWFTLYPKMKFDGVKFRKLFSDLLRLVEGFLAQQIYDENPLHQATYLIEAVGKNGMSKLYSSTMRNARRLSKQQFLQPANYYYYQYQIEKNFFELSEHEFKRVEKKNLEEIADNLDLFYIAEKLRYYCAILSHQHIISHEYKMPFIDNIIEQVRSNKYNEIPPIAIYYQIYLTLTDIENTNHYYILKELLEKHGLQFPKMEAYNIYDSTMNYCIRKINAGHPHFLKEYFDIYVDFLEKEIIFIRGQLTLLQFKNIIVTALRLGKYEWTEKFITNYQYRLPEASRENAVTFNYARLYFYQKKHDKVIELLREVEYEDVTYNLSSKAILLFTYYETDEVEPLYSLMESFRTFLNRHKEIPAQRRKNYHNLIKFTKKLTKIIAGEKKAIDKIKAEIDNTPALVNKDWLLEKIAELE